MMRKAEPRDEAAVRALIEQLEESPVDSTRFGEVYKSNIADANVHYIVYDDEGVIAGFISLHIQKLLHHTANIAEIQELIVESAYRGRGIGRLLYEKVEEIALEAGCPQIELCCNIKRKNSHAFYRAMGMEARHFKFTGHSGLGGILYN